MIRATDNPKPIGSPDIAVAELEAVGLSVRTINMLEDSLNIIWLNDLLQYTPEELKDSVPNLGNKTLEEILTCIRRFVQIQRANRRLSVR